MTTGALLNALWGHQQAIEDAVPLPSTSVELARAGVYAGGARGSQARGRR